MAVGVVGVEEVWGCERQQPSGASSDEGERS